MLLFSRGKLQQTDALPAGLHLPMQPLSTSRRRKRYFTLLLDNTPRKRVRQSAGCRGRWSCPASPHAHGPTLIWVSRSIPSPTPFSPSGHRRCVRCNKMDCYAAIVCQN